eukprot:scaffold175391_cov21-Tisochrysis_lutea.AAC.1
MKLLRAGDRIYCFTAIISCAIGILYLGGPVDLPLLGAISLPLHEATKATQSFTGGIMPAGSASHPDYL